ncbi:MAG: hypothetical protein HC819_22825 [Cyclobacteriaceae bacterium]|nr:hypothetical protein [Cyclobacteriaceae bacterium]
MGDFKAFMMALGYIISGQNLLSGFGVSTEETIDILMKFFFKSQNLLKGPLVDDVPLSEVLPIRNYTPAPDERNYIEWLIDAASTSHNTLRRQEGFKEGKIPSAMLYLMLHHALDLNFVEVSLKLHLQAELINNNQLIMAKQEPAYIHVAENVKQSESKWNYLYKKESKITGNQDLEIGEYIPKVIKTHVATAYLKEQVEALTHLQHASTASLERAFVEHIDLCTYRLDAWKNGILNYQLTMMRQQGPNDNDEIPYRRGVYIGAYGILEGVKSEHKNLSEIKRLDDDIKDSFLDPDHALYRDDTNGGYIAAPSLNHAVTAAVLRNGYMENASQANPDLLSVNLSSERVRKALGLIEGIRGGQSLSELLGYQLERGLHDGYPGLEMDVYIYELRRAFPLRANKHSDTRTPANTPIEEIEARNVVDGLSLINHLKTQSANAVYPYGKSLSTDGLTTPMINAIKAEVNNIRDLNDAVSDVAIAESVHQVVQGNYDRGAATLNTYSKGTFPPIPDVVQTPRSGVNLTHRLGIHLESGLNPLTSPTAYPMTPRAKGEPALNKWLAGLLPDPDSVACKVSYYDHASASFKEEEVTQHMLKIQGIDLLYTLNIDMEQAVAQIDDQVIQYIRDNFTVRPDAEINIKYMDKIPGKTSLFELSAMINSLRSLVLNCRPLQAQDVTKPTEAKEEDTSQWQLDIQRIALNKSGLESIMANANPLKATISGFTDAEPLDIVQIINQSNTWANSVLAILKEALAYGNPQAAIGSVHDGKASLFRLVMKRVNETIERFEAKLVSSQQKIDEANLALTEEEKIALLALAEREIKTENTFPAPATAAAYLALLNTQKGLFINKMNALKSIADTSNTSLTSLYNALEAVLPLSEFDTEEIDLAPIQNQIVLFCVDLVSRLQLLVNDLNVRIAKVDGFLAEHAATADSRKQVQALENAGKAIFGDDYKMFHEFTIDAEQASEWHNAYLAKAQLLNHIQTTGGVDFPLDDWLYGLARVREKLHHWENITFLNEAFGKPELQLHPIQLPHIPNDHWLGLDYPEDFEINDDKLLYTAYYPAPFDASKNQCGLLIDEWTELIPSKKETAGVTFHYDRPNSEPPQVMLLAMPTDFRGEWQWSDLVDAIHETMDMAKKRAIEPDHVDDSSYARFLPATISSAQTIPLAPSLNYSFNNLVHEILLKNGN